MVCLAYEAIYNMYLICVPPTYANKISLTMQCAMVQNKEFREQNYNVSNDIEEVSYWNHKEVLMYR